MDVVFSIPALWIPSSGHQRKSGTGVQSISFGANEQGCWLQTLSQNIRVTLDGTTPSIGGNDTGFTLRSTDPPFLFTGTPGQTIKFLQEAPTAVVQFQMLTLSDRYR